MWRILCLAVAAVWFIECSAASKEPLFSQLLPQRTAEIDPNEDYTLSQHHGPWLVVAATFSGEGAKEQAHELTMELRRDFNLRAYVHGKSFNLKERAPVSGFDAYGRPRRKRFQRGDEVTEFAVLVGDFPAVDDPLAQDALAKIKRIEPTTLTGKTREKSTQTLAAWRTITNAITSGDDDGNKRGPMGAAFLSRNPLLPTEYFVPKGVDEFVEQMNRGVQYSLLDCPGQFTVKVATFRGHADLKTASDIDPSSSTFRGETKLHIAADKAHRLTLALREKKWEAYEFHDVDESIVTVGSFDNVATQLPDGRVVPTRDVEIIIRTFDAAYKPATGTASFDATKRKAEEIRQQFSHVFAQQQGAISTGLYPKSVIGIPLDIHPMVISAPKRSISTAYMRKSR